MTNLDVIDAKILHHQGEIDSSLRVGLKILASNEELTPIDSFNTYQILAYNLRDLKSYNLSLEYAKKAVKSAKNAFPEAEVFNNIKWISTYYLAIGDYKKSISIFKEDLNNLRKSQDTLNILKAYNDIGFTYFLDNQIDSAIYYYQKVIQTESDNRFIQEIIGLTTGNLGSIYMQKKEYETAIKYFEIDARISKGINYSSYYNAIVATAECYFILKKYNITIETLDILNDLPKTQKTSPEPNAILKRYELYMESYSQLSKSKESIHYMRKYNHLKDSLSQKDLQSFKLHESISKYKISGIQKDLELSTSKLELIESKKHRLNLFIMFLIILLTLIIIVVVAYLKRQKEKKEIQKLKLEVTSLELINKKKDLSTVVSNLTFIRRFIDDSMNKIKAMHKEKPETVKQEINLLLQDFKRFKNSDNTLAILQSDLETINSEFFSKLERLFPELTLNERELCGLFLLKITSKDIAAIRNVTPNAIKKARQRLRSKLPITEKEDLVSFLQNL